MEFLIVIAVIIAIFTFAKGIKYGWNNYPYGFFKKVWFFTIWFLLNGFFAGVAGAGEIIGLIIGLPLFAFSLGVLLNRPFKWLFDFFFNTSNTIKVHKDSQKRELEDLEDKTHLERIKKKRKKIKKLKEDLAIDKEYEEVLDEYLETKGGGKGETKMSIFKRLGF